MNNGAGRFLLRSGIWLVSKLVDSQEARCQCGKATPEVVRDALVAGGGTVLDEQWIDGEWLTESRWEYIGRTSAVLNRSLFKICQ